MSRIEATLTHMVTTIAHVDDVKFNVMVVTAYIEDGTAHMKDVIAYIAHVQCSKIVQHPE